MLNLCQQLAREISAKTSASMEIIRLKESRKIEREIQEKKRKKGWLEVLATSSLKLLLVLVIINFVLGNIWLLTFFLKSFFGSG